MKDKKNQTWYFLILISIMYKKFSFKEFFHVSRSSMKISSNEYCEYCSNTEWILWEILNIVKIWFPPPCQINLSTVAKQSLHCLFAEEGKHYTAIIGFPQRFTRQINDNFTPHVFLEPISSCARNTHVCHSIFLQYSIWSKSNRPTDKKLFSFPFVAARINDFNTW